MDILSMPKTLAAFKILVPGGRLQFAPGLMIIRSNIDRDTLTLVKISGNF